MNSYNSIGSILNIPNIVQYCNAKYFNGLNVEQPTDNEIVGTTDKRWRNLVPDRHGLDMYRRNIYPYEFGGLTLSDNYAGTTEPIFKRSGIYPSVYFQNRAFITWAGDRSSFNKTNNECTWVLVENLAAYGVTYQASSNPSGTYGGFVKDVAWRVGYQSGSYSKFNVATKYSFNYCIMKWKPGTGGQVTYSGDANFNYNPLITNNSSTLVPDSEVYFTANRVPMYGTSWKAGQSSVYPLASSGNLYMVMMFERFTTTEEDFRILSHIRSEFNL